MQAIEVKSSKAQKPKSPKAHSYVNIIAIERIKVEFFVRASGNISVLCFY